MALCLALKGSKRSKGEEEEGRSDRGGGTEEGLLVLAERLVLGVLVQELVERDLRRRLSTKGCGEL